MTREHRSDVADLDADITEAITVLREALGPMEGSVEDRALCAVEALSADAARYRWLKANTGDQIPYRGWWQIAGGAGADPQRLDAAIDAARLETA